MRSDLELVEKVRKGDRAAYSELVQRHQKALLRLAMRFLGSLELAEDVVQESFLKAYKKINHFEGRSSFKSWIYQITVNTARNKLRSRKRETVDIENVHLSEDAQAESSLVRGDIKTILRREVEVLPDRQRTALMLRIYEDLSFKEIASIMDCPYDTAKANYRHGLMKIKEKLGKQDLLASWDNSETAQRVETKPMEVDS